MSIFKHAFLGIASAALFSVSANAIPLNPNDFLSLGALPTGDITIDTDTLTVSGLAGSGVLSAQIGGPNIAVFTFDDGATFATGNNLFITGSNPLALLFQGAVTISGTIDISGENGASVSQGGGGDGVAGGGDGGNGGPFNETDGTGPGAGLAGSTSASTSGAGSGSGAGFGTPGGQGGAGTTFRAGGSAYGSPLSDTLFAGSGGGGGGNQSSSRGGCGGAGRIEILHNVNGSALVEGTVEAFSGVGKDACDTATNVFSTIAQENIGEAPTNGGGGNSVPEPGTLGLLCVGLAGLGMLRRRRSTQI